MICCIMKIYKQEKGVVIVYALFLLVIMSLLIPTMSQLIKTSYKQTSKQLSSLGQAENVARAGLIDAMSWFRRQDVQPVRSKSDPITYHYTDAAFDPKFSTDTAKSDTMDPFIGIVQEYQLSDSGNTWARYEVRKQSSTVSFPYDPHAVHDITSQRLKDYEDGDGLIWYIESIGYVYWRRNPGQAYNVAPNEVIDKARVATEIRRLALVLPANAAFITNDGGVVGSEKIVVNNNGRILGGATGAGVAQVSGSAPLINAGGEVSGSPANQLIPNIPTCEYVFGVNIRELKIMSDITVDNVASLPTNLPSVGLIYIEGDATFDGTRPLRGGGVLFVNGDLTLDGTSNTLFSGLIYVTGIVDIDGPALIGGVLIAEGGITISGGVDVSQVEFDKSIIDSVRQQLANYRTSKAVYRIFSVTRLRGG